MCILKYVHESLLQFIHTYNVYIFAEGSLIMMREGGRKVMYPYMYNIHVHVELFYNLSQNSAWVLAYDGEVIPIHTVV